LSSLIQRNIVPHEVNYSEFINNALLMKMIFMEIQLTLPTTPAERKYAKQFNQSDFWHYNSRNGTITKRWHYNSRIQTHQRSKIGWRHQAQTQCVVHKA
jgi:hypothetical protein